MRSRGATSYQMKLSCPWQPARSRRLVGAVDRLGRSLRDLHLIGDHIHGAHAPGEEPSTASIAEVAYTMLDCPCVLIGPKNCAGRACGYRSTKRLASRDNGMLRSPTSCASRQELFPSHRLGQARPHPAERWRTCCTGRGSNDETGWPDTHSRRVGIWVSCAENGCWWEGAAQ